MEQRQENLFPEFQFLGSATRFAEEIHEVIDHAPLFDELSFAEIEALCGFMVCYAAPRNGILLNEGEQGDFLVVLLTGHVDVQKVDADGTSKTIASVGPGASLGEMSMIDSQRRFATCVATEPCDFAVLSHKALNDILVTLPRLGNKFLLLLLQLMTARLRDVSTRLLPNIGPASV
jgi:CRP/FNR family transcriptional regulator, cyclic AMP receptor protein